MTVEVRAEPDGVCWGGGGGQMSEVGAQRRMSHIY